MKTWKMKMQNKKNNKSKDIRICGDCKYSEQNPIDNSALMLCYKPVHGRPFVFHRAESVDYCDYYAIEEGQDDSKKEETKKS